MDRHSYMGKTYRRSLVYRIRGKRLGSIGFVVPYIEFQSMPVFGL